MKKLILGIFIVATINPIILYSQESEELRLVSWNIEHLAEKNDQGCVPRTDKDYEKLRDFAETLDADIVALQEVESKKAVARVFPEDAWNIIISDRPASSSYTCRGNGHESTQQKVAIAIRKGIAFEELESFKALALGRSGLRYGVVIRLTGTPEPIEVMAVHLKSGCFVEDYSTSDRSACETFERQAPILDTWMESKIEQKQGFIVLGDFNHRIANPDNRFWKELIEMDDQPVSIKNSMENLEGCHPRYPEPIDHILIDPAISKYYKEGSEAVHYFGMTVETIREENMLSDHCPISVVLEFK